jgi:hypothetical protein
VPLVARVVVDVHPRVDWQLLRQRHEQVEGVESELQSFDFLGELDKLTPLEADVADCRRLQNDVRDWLWGQAWAAVPYMLCVGFFVAKLSSEGMELPQWIYWLAALILSSSLCVWIVFVGLELRSRNRMTEIFRKYEWPTP